MPKTLAWLDPEATHAGRDRLLADLDAIVRSLEQKPLQWAPPDPAGRSTAEGRFAIVGAAWADACRHLILDGQLTRLGGQANTDVEWFHILRDHPALHQKLSIALTVLAKSPPPMGTLIRQKALNLRAASEVQAEVARAEMANAHSGLRDNVPGNPASGPKIPLISDLIANAFELQLILAFAFAGGPNGYKISVDHKVSPDAAQQARDVDVCLRASSCRSLWAEAKSMGYSDNDYLAVDGMRWPVRDQQANYLRSRLASAFEKLATTREDVAFIACISLWGRCSDEIAHDSIGELLERFPRISGVILASSFACRQVRFVPGRHEITQLEAAVITKAVSSLRNQLAFPTRWDGWRL